MQTVVDILSLFPMDYPSLLPATFYRAVTYESQETPPSPSQNVELSFGELVFH